MNNNPRNYEPNSHRGVFPISREKRILRGGASVGCRLHAGYHCTVPLQNHCCEPQVPAGCLFANTARALPRRARPSRVDITICYKFGNTIRASPFRILYIRVPTLESDVLSSIYFKSSNCTVEFYLSHRRPLDVY